MRSLSRGSSRLASGISLTCSTKLTASMITSFQGVVGIWLPGQVEATGTGSPRFRRASPLKPFLAGHAARIPLASVLEYEWSEMYLCYCGPVA